MLEGLSGIVKVELVPLGTTTEPAATTDEALATADIDERASGTQGLGLCEQQVAPVWEVVMDEVRPISDGRPLSFFMATRIR